MIGYGTKGGVFLSMCIQESCLFMGYMFRKWWHTHDDGAKISRWVITEVTFVLSFSLLHSCKKSSQLAPILASLIGGQSTSAKWAHKSIKLVSVIRLEW